MMKCPHCDSGTVNDVLLIKLECMRYKLEGVEKYGLGLA